ncbi:MAG: hypothetical protein HY763_09510 [Planctomycetes bacterium]|nr:hypothetical protein [Planctomycetota bacterium]
MVIRRIRPLACLAAGLLLAGGARAQSAGKPDAAASKTEVAAHIGGEAVLLTDVDAKVLKTNMRLAQMLYDARRSALDQMVLERVLGPEAAAKGISLDEMIRQRVSEKAKPVEDADVEAFYKTNAARMGGKTLEQVAGQIRSQLVNQNENAARSNLIAELKQKAGVKIVLDAPRADVTVAANDPVMGPADAKVTIVEFSDFQ